MSEESKYRQLAIFTTIVAEVVITPSVMGGLAYWLLKNSTFQTAGTAIAALLGLVVAFYRIFLIKKRMDEIDKDEAGRK